jgi:REP element-mobilizing transposase RayT
MSRTALDGFPLGDIEKDFMLDLIRRYSTLYFVEILGFCLMGNHFHILVKTLPEYKLTDEDIKARVRRYRRYVYEAGAMNRPEKGKTKLIDDRILEKERKRKFELSRNDRFRYRTRYFTDSGVIGSKEFVLKTYMRFKNHFNSKKEKRPKAIKGLSEVYSLKRLSEFI